MKLFVDDIRACPPGWTLARTVTQAIRILATYAVEVVSLDHDIACRLVNGHEHTSEETFEAVARFIALMPIKPTTLIHTGNIAAGQILADILGLKYGYTIFNPADYGEGGNVVVE